MSKDDLTKILSEPKTSLSKERIKDIKEDFNKLRDRFLKQKIKEIRRNFYEIENKKNLSKSKIKEIEQNLIELEESLFKLNKYYDYDDAEYKGIRDIENLFGEFNDENYYEPIKTKDAFNNNYIEYESRGDKNKNLSLKQYLYTIIPHLRNMINNHKTLGEWKIQLSMKINFVSSKDYSDETRIMSNWSNNIEIIMGNEADDIIDELIKSFLQRYQKSLEKSMKKGSDFIFNSVDLLCYHLHKISLKRGGSYIDSPKWLKNKGATINPKNEDDQCFKYALTVPLNNEKIKNHPERISKIKPFIDQYKWK